MLIAAVSLLLAACDTKDGGAVTSGPAGGPSAPLAAAARAYPGVGTSQQSGLWVTGAGRVTYTPDIVLLRLGVEAEALIVADAQVQARMAMGRVLAVLEAKGVPKEDVQTTQFSIQPVYQWLESKRKQELTGYRVSNIVQVKIRQVSAAGGVIDAAAEVGGDVVRIQGISFDIDNPSLLQDQARDLAVKEAVAKAQQIAGAAGIALAEVIYIGETTSSLPTHVPAMRMEAAAI
ncbi:MAG: SIMPL domain-containing protein, partial [Dehalococcoidia bacterium]|nr:SIMPL domain-containing protein [Dehalococcoidia bacterium]